MRDIVPNGLRFLHCADIHLDAPFTSVGTEGGRSSTRRQDLKESFQRIIDLAGCENVDLLLICGDLYEHNYVRKSTIDFVNHCFSQIQKTKVVIIPGNHDPYIFGSYYKTYKWNQNVTILTPEKSRAFFEELNTWVYFLGNEYLDIDTKFINILMGHGTLDLDLDPKAYNLILSRDIEQLDMDYTALGHFHKMFRDTGSKNNIFNPGSPEPMGFDETGVHGVFLGNIVKTSSGDSNMDIRFVPIAKRYYESMEVRVDRCSADQQVVVKISSELENKNLLDGLFKITLTGYVERGYKPDISYIQSLFKDEVFFIKIEDQSIPDYNFEGIIKEPGLRGLFARKMIALIGREEDDIERKKLERALYFGMEALDYGQVNIDLRGEL
jgi:exonuclease SbcD